MYPIETTPPLNPENSRWEGEYIYPAMPTRNEPSKSLLNDGKTQEAFTDQTSALSEAPQIPSPALKAKILQFLHERKTEQALALCVGLGDPFLLLQLRFNAAKNQGGKDLPAVEYFEAIQSKINYSLQELMGQTTEPAQKVGWLQKILRWFGK